jgi:multidrug transporter EmrE-like cation transporter
MKLFRRAAPTREHTSPLDIDYQPPVPAREKRRGKMWLILVILLSVGLAATAQLTLKYGVDRVTKHGPSGEVSGIVLSEPVGSAIRVAKEPFIWIGLALFGISAAVWIVVLSRTQLSFAYPFAALTYVIILLFDRIFLKVHQPGLRWAGVLLIVSGIVLISRTPN